MLRSSSLTLSPELRSNIRHLYADIAWFGVVSGSTVAFLSIFAARIGASGFEIGMLSAAPGIVNLFLSLPTGSWLEGRSLIRDTFWSSLLMRLGYLLLIPLPWFFQDQAQVTLIIGITLLMSIPGTVLAIAFNAMFADLVPPELRAEVVGRRNALLAVVMTVSVLITGQILDYVIFPLNYQIVFVLGAVGAFLSSYHLSRLRQGMDKQIGLRSSLSGLVRWGKGQVRARLGSSRLRLVAGSTGRPLLRPDLLRGPFGVFMFAYLVFYIFQYVPLPLFPLYQVNNLDLSDGFISLGSGLFYIMMMLTSLRLNQLSIRRGNRFMLAAGALAFGLYPLIMYLARDATLYWVASLVGGGIWALLSGSLINRLMERVPEDDRPAHMALHNLVLNVGVLAGSLLGPALAGWVGLRDAILVSAGLRLVAGVLIWIWG